MRILLCVIFLTLILLVTRVFAYDVKSMFEYADGITLEEARTQAAKASNDQESLYVLALVSLKFYQNQDAGVIFEKLLAADPGSEIAQWGKAELFRRRRDFINAEKMLDEILKKDPLFTPALLTRAYIQYIHFNFEECVDACEKIIEQGKEKVDMGNYVRAYAIMAGAKGMIAHYGGWLSKLINGTRVLSTLKKAESLLPDSPSVLLGLGSFYLCAPSAAGGSVKEAEKYLLRTIEADPLMPEAYVRLAQFYKLKGNEKKYKELLDKALSIDPQNEIALDIKNQTCRFICP